MTASVDTRKGADGVAESAIPIPNQKKAEEEPSLELRMILTRLGMKLLRFVFLGHLYYSYEVFACLPNISLHKFPPVYLYAWTSLSVLLGVYLFIFGRPSLCGGDEILNYIFQLDKRTSFGRSFSLLSYLLSGPTYRHFNTLLNLIFPYVFISSVSAHAHLSLSHSRFVPVYYVSLALAHLKGVHPTLGRLFGRVRWTVHSGAISAHLLLCLLAGNWWGAIGSILMAMSTILVTRDKDKDDAGFGFSSKMISVSGTVLHALVATGSSFAITMSFKGMSSFVEEGDGDREVALVTREDLNLILKPITTLFLGDSDYSPSQVQDYEEL